MIQNVPFSKLDIQQLSTLSQRSHDLVVDKHPENTSLSGSLSAVDEAIKLANLAIGSSTKEALTAEIVNADSKIDDNFMGIRDHIDAGLKRHANVNYQSACQRLSVLINQNGRTLHRESYSSQTAKLNSLFQDLSMEQSVLDLATIKATEWLEELKTDVATFDDLYAQRNEDRVTTDIPTDGEAKKQLKSSLEALFMLINGLHLGNLLEGSEATIALLNETINNILSSIR